MKQHITVVYTAESLGDVARATDRYIRGITDADTLAYYNCYDCKGDRLQAFNRSEKGIELKDVPEEIGRMADFLTRLYSKNVNISRPGNGSLVLLFIVPASDAAAISLMEKWIQAAIVSRTNIEIEMLVLDHTLEAKLCNRTEGELSERRKANLEGVKALAELVEKNTSLVSLKIISDININGLSLNIDIVSMSRILGELIVLNIENHRELRVNRNLISTGRIIESIGLSGLIFDKKYFFDYLRGRATVLALESKGIGENEVDVNKIDDIVHNIVERARHNIEEFYGANVRPLESTGMDRAAIISRVAPKIDEMFAAIIREIDELVTDGKLSLPEREAVLAMILGQDSDLFTGSTISRDPLSLEDLSTLSVNEYTGRDKQNFNRKELIENAKVEKDRVEVKRIVEDNCVEEIRKYRDSIRNATQVLRSRRAQLDAIKESLKNDRETGRRLTRDGFVFDGITRRLTPGTEIGRPLDETWTPTGGKLPRSLDMRTRFSEVRDQGEQGACAAFTIAAILEYMTRDNNAISNDLSEAFLYYNARSSNGDEFTDTGTTFYDIIHGAMKWGVCEENIFPYDENVLSVQPSDDVLENASRLKIVKAMNVDTNIENIKAALNQGYPVAGAFQVFDSFSNGNGGFVEMPEENEAAGDFNHAMVICGYSDEYKILIVRNSWGEKFGDNGYCYIPYLYAEKYLRQACIVTKIEVNGDNEEVETVRPHVPTAVNFNMTDSGIQAGILQALITQEHADLAKMISKYNSLKTQHTRIVAALANPNVRNQIARETNERLESDINELRILERLTQEEKNRALDETDSKKTFNIIIYGILIVMMVGWGIYCFTKFEFAWQTWLTAGIYAAVLSICIFYYSWKHRRQRSAYNETIQNIADNIGRIQLEKKRNDLILHVHGMMLDQLQKLVQHTTRSYQRLKGFNNNLEVWREEELEDLGKMQVDIKEPFVGMIENRLLDSYFEQNSNRLIGDVNLQEAFNSYELNEEGPRRAKESVCQTIDKALEKALENFSVSGYLSGYSDNPGFLSPVENLSQLLSTLETRANVLIRPMRVEVGNNSSADMAFMWFNSGEDKQRWYSACNQYFNNPPSPYGIISRDRLLLYRSRVFTPEEIGCKPAK